MGASAWFRRLTPPLGDGTAQGAIAATVSNVLRCAKSPLQAVVSLDPTALFCHGRKK